MEKLGVTNLWIVLALGIEMGNVADKMGRTKGAMRYAGLMDLFDELMALGKVDFSAVKLELKDLDGTEREELKAKIKAKFDITDDKLEIVIEEGIDIVESQYQVVERSLALVKSLKA